MGKNKLSAEFINQVRSALEKEKLIKISVLRSACRDREELKELASGLVRELGLNYDFKIIGYVITVMKFRKSFKRNKE